MNANDDNYNLNQNVCRICLNSKDLPLFCLSNTPLKAIFEKLTDIDLNYTDISKVCYICFARLKKCYILCQQAIIADKLLKEAVQCNVKPNQLQNFNKLSKSSTINIKFDPIDCNNKVLAEVKTEENEDILHEIQHIALTCQENIETDNIKDSFSDSDNDERANLDDDINIHEEEINTHLDNEVNFKLDEINITDSEDDMPLVDISTKKNIKCTEEKAMKVRKYRRKGKALTGSERAKRYRDKLKQNPEKFEAQRQKQLERVKKNRKKIADLSEKEKLRQRKMWRDQKKKQKKTKLRETKSNNRIVKKSNSYEPLTLTKKKKTEVDAKEIILDEEQQKMEMLERSKSENYINSPFKCDLCYRGFVDPVAFERHKEKHDEMSGPHACTLCQLRYSSHKRLAAHVATHVRRYACARCPHLARTKHQAKAHEQWHDGHTYPCQPCGRVFTKPTSLLSHARRCPAGAGLGVDEGESRERACPLCGDTFSRGHGLLMHMSKSHRFQKQEPPSEPESDRTCDTCCIVFANSKARVRHLLTSRRHTLYNSESQCGVCGALVSASMRHAHTRSHARALRPPAARPAAAAAPCDQCKASFTSRAKLQNHIRRMHLGLKYNKNIICEICGKKCTSLAALRYHQRRHTGERPYACGACGLAFARASRLRAHARRHSGERPHACALCPRAFAQRPALTRHARVHTGAKPYGCHICNKRFSQSNSLHAHVRALHLKIPRTRTRDHLDTTHAQVATNFNDYVQNRVQS